MRSTEKVLFLCLFYDQTEVKTMVYEQEYTPTEPEKDMIFVLDGRGQFIELEVEDDVSDD